MITMKTLQNKKTCYRSIQLDDIEKFLRLFAYCLEYKTEANIGMWYILLLFLYRNPEDSSLKIYAYRAMC